MHQPDPRQLVLSRRACLATGLAASCVGGAAAASRPFFRRHGLPLGLQLYTLGDIGGDLDAVLAQVAAIGYRTVELAGYYGRTLEALRRALDGAGLRCTSAHMPLPPQQDFSKIAAQAHVLGFDRVIAPIFRFPPDANMRPGPGETVMDVIGRIGRELASDRWKAEAELLNQAGEALRGEGIRVGYHNHNIEFAPGPGGETGFEILLRETDPKLVTFELDAGWVAAAGLDPVALLRAHSGRFELMHVKDIKASTQPNFSLKQDSAEVGSGALDWARILPAAYAAGVRRFFVEQEPPFARPAIEAVGVSFRYLDGLVA